MRLSQTTLLATLVDPWRDPRVPEVAVVAAVEVAVLWLYSAEDDRRRAVAMVSLPLPPSARRSAARPTELFAAAFTLPAGGPKRGFYLVVGELVGVFQPLPHSEWIHLLIWLRWGR